MNNSSKSIAALSAAPILSSLAEIMLEEGVSYAEFAELARYAFVSAAEKVLASEKRITDSRVSIITGIHRKDVKHLRTMDGPGINSEKAKSNRAIAVISAWTREPPYLDRKDEPLALPYDGDSPSLSELIQAYSGDMPVRAVCDELERMGVIEQRKDHWHLIIPVYVPNKSRSAIFDILATDASDLIRTIHHNLNEKPAKRRFQRTVSYDEISPETANHFKTFAADDALSLLKRFDAWLAKREKEDKIIRKKQPDTTCVRAGVGIYYFEEPLTTTPDGE